MYDFSKLLTARVFLSGVARGHTSDLVRKQELKRKEEEEKNKNKNKNKTQQQHRTRAAVEAEEDGGAAAFVQVLRNDPRRALKMTSGRLNGRKNPVGNHFFSPVTLK